MSLFNELLRPAFVLGRKSVIAEGPACPKCRWTGKEPGLGWTKYTWVSRDDAARHNLRDEAGNPLGECLLVQCERCGYRWREDAATVEQEAAPS